MKPHTQRLLAGCLLAWCCASAWAQQRLLPAQSQLRFVSKQMGAAVEGRFGKFDAQIQFDPKHLASSHIDFNIDLGSVEIGDANTIAEVKKPGWFNTALFPQASFRSATIVPRGSGHFDVSGLLRIKGKAQNITVPIQLTQQAGTTIATGHFDVKRLDFGIGDGEWNDTSLVANAVQVQLKLAITGIPALSP